VRDSLSQGEARSHGGAKKREKDGGGGGRGERVQLRVGCGEKGSSREPPYSLCARHEKRTLKKEDDVTKKSLWEERARRD